MQVVATVSNAALPVDLHWTNGPTQYDFPCPNPGNPAVSCEASGTSVTWNLQVGTGARTFYVTSGSATTSTYTIQLTVGSSPQAPPNQPLSVTALSPSQGQSLQVGQSFLLSAAVSDSASITAASASWAGPQGVQEISLTPSGDGTTWSRWVQVGPSALPGARTVTFQAQDNAGQISRSQPIEVTIVSR
jgi:hypothetical protein